MLVEVAVRVRVEGKPGGCAWFEGGEKGEVEAEIEVLRGKLRLFEGVGLDGDQGLRGLWEELLGRIEDELTEVLIGAGPRREG